MLWCKQAPNVDETNFDVISSYIDKYVTCSKPQDDDELLHLVCLQMHKHNKSCRKGKKTVSFWLSKTTNEKRQ